MELNATVSLDDIVYILRKGYRHRVSLPDGVDSFGDTKYRHVSGIYHWYNLFLDLQFSSHYYEGSQQFPAVDSTLMTSKEFYQLAQQYYRQLKAAARLNFAKVSPIGLEELVRRKLLLTPDQWGDQLSSQWELGKKLGDRRALTQFYNSLTRDNQVNLQEALENFAARSPENLEVVLSSYDIVSTDFDRICRMATGADIRFCSARVENVSDLMTFFAKISPISRMAVLESDTFTRFQGYGQGTLLVFLHREFPVDGYTYRDMLAFIDKHLDSNASDFLERREQVIAKFGLALIADYEHTIPGMDPGGELEVLHQQSPWLQKIIVECSKKKAFDAAVDEEGNAAFFVKSDDMSFVSGSGKGDTLQFKPPSYEDLLVSARTFVQSNPRLAVEIFCQAMNAHKEDDAESSRKAQKIAAILKRLQQCNEKIECFNKRFERERHLVEKRDQLEKLDREKNSLLERKAGCEDQLARAREMVVSLEERTIDPAVLKQAADLAREQALTPMYPRLIELYDRYGRQQMDNIDSFRDKGALFIKLSQREIERAYLIRESRSEYAVPTFVTSPDGLIALTEQYLEDASGAVYDPQGQAVLNQCAQAWLFIARAAPVGHSISKRALMYLIDMRGREGYDDVLACLDAFPAGHDFVLTCLQRLYQLKGLEASHDVLSRLASFPQEASPANLKKATLMRLALTLAAQDNRHPSRAALKKCFVFPSRDARGCLGPLFYPPRRYESFYRYFSTVLHEWDEGRFLEEVNKTVEPLIFEAADLPTLQVAFPKPKPKPKPIVVKESDPRAGYYVVGGVCAALAAAGATVVVLGAMNIIAIGQKMSPVVVLGAALCVAIAIAAFIGAKKAAPQRAKATDLAKQGVLNSKAGVPGALDQEFDVTGKRVGEDQKPPTVRRMGEDPYNRVTNVAVQVNAN